MRKSRSFRNCANRWLSHAAKAGDNSWPVWFGTFLCLGGPFHYWYVKTEARHDPLMQAERERRRREVVTAPAPAPAPAPKRQGYLKTHVRTQEPFPKYVPSYMPKNRLSLLKRVKLYFRRLT